MADSSTYRARTVFALAIALTLAACEDEATRPPNAQANSGGNGAAGVSAGMTGGVGGACLDPLACCAPLHTACDGACTALATDPNNCGACGQRCPEPAACNAGQCGCPSGMVACGGRCVDLLTDAQHCGLCGHACGDAASCSGGSCACPQELTSCGAACADVQSDEGHCGACGNACAPDQVCAAGRCACAVGQTECEGACVDLHMSAEHCGACSVACADGHVCMAGVCRGAIGADGCGDLAQGVTLEQIDVYQSMRVPIMQGGQAITFYERRADVIAGRDALFRISVTTDLGFLPRELSARVTLYNPDGDDQYFAKQRIAGDSRDADTSTTFQIRVAAGRIQPETRYAVELVECAAGSGAVRAPRFPASGDVMLEPLTTGVLKVAVVPVEVNALEPDTSEAALEVYRDYLMAMYPITGLELSVTDAISTGYPIDWSGLLDQIRDKRQADSPPDEVYYYGWVKAADTYEEFCDGACTLGIGYVVASPRDVGVRAAVGIAFADENSAWTMAHELGHSHGRNHAPCGVTADADGNFPYARGGAGVWGYDIRRDVFLDPADTNDLMGYCNPKWISDYTFQGIANRMVALGTSPALAEPLPTARWRVIVLDARGARWGQPFRKPGPAFGLPEPAVVIDRQGAPIDAITVYRTEVSGDHGGSAAVLVPERRPGWHGVRLRGEHVPIDVPFDAP